LTLLQHSVLLYLAAAFFKAVGALTAHRQAWRRRLGNDADAPAGDGGPLDKASADDEELERAHESYEEACWHGYNLIAQSDGLRLFESQTGLNLDRVRRGLPGYQLVVEAEQLARKCAFDMLEAADWLWRQGDEDAVPPAAGDVAEAMRDYLDKRGEWLGPRKQ
jgi:hypothetical protein